MNIRTEHFPRISRRILLRNLVAGGLAATTVGGCGLFTPPRSPLKATLLFTYNQHTSGTNALAWSPDGTRIASHSWDKPGEGPEGIRPKSPWDRTIQVWDATTRAYLLTYRGHANEPAMPNLAYPYAITALAWSPDSTRIVSGAANGSIHVWKIST